MRGVTHLECYNWVVMKSTYSQVGLVGLVPVGFCSVIPAPR